MGWRVALSRDGKVLASVGGDHSVKLWNTATGKEARALDHPRALRVVFSPAGKLLATGSGDPGGGLGPENKGQVKLWDATTGKGLKSFPTPGGNYSLAFSPNGGLLAASSSTEVYIWSVGPVIKEPSK